VRKSDYLRLGRTDTNERTDVDFRQWKGQSMSWSDALKGVVGNIVGQAEQAALPDLLKSVLGTEGLQTILAKLQDAGFQAQVSSWLDKNKNNLPITADQIKAALGDEHVQQIAKSLGIPVDAILAALAEKLPELANAAGPAAAPTGTSIPDPKAS
jgi:uncharacterized protein YidB (DUF937 family)